MSKNSVSYGELQIILENVQVVKNKAQSSIKYFEMKNDAMKIEIDKLTEELNQCQLLNKTD